MVSNPAEASLQAGLTAAIRAAGLAGTVWAGHDAEQNYIWARWDTPGGLHLLARAEAENYSGNEPAYVASFVNLCQSAGPSRRPLNGLIPVVRWTA